MRKIIRSLGFVGLLYLASCESSSQSVIAIPNVNIACSAATDGANCSSASPCNPNLTSVVFMSRSGCDSSNYEPIATGSTILSCDAQGCSGTVGAWTDPSTSESVTEILTGRMDICSNIDMDCSSGASNTGDLVNERATDLQSNTALTIDNWSEL